MPNRILFEYAVIRVVPRVEREEFFNAGVILYCAGARFLEARIDLELKKLSGYRSELDASVFIERLEAFRKIANGSKEGGAIAQLPPASRFRWLTAVRSTLIQTSAVHPGMCKDPKLALDKLFADLVL